MFYFKQFSVRNAEGAMKVGTDAIMLGAWMPVPDGCKTILDIGCGCGVISFMLASITNAHVTGIDIDEKSIEEANKNAEEFTWKNRIQFIWDSVQNFSQKTTQKFEVIVTNPPFFENSLKSPEKSRNLSRHNDSLPFEELIAAVDILLSENGRFGIILPPEQAEKVEELALQKSLYATKKTCLFPTREKKSNRILTIYERNYAICEKDNTIIRDGSYTNEYYMLVKDFLKITN